MLSDASTPSVRWIATRKLVGGSNNKGIELVIESGSGRLAIRKSIDPEMMQNSIGNEVGIMRRLASHKNIVQIYDFVPASPQGPHLDELYVEYCKSLIRGQEINTVFQLNKLYMLEDKAVPELFLWHLLEGLLRVIVYMQFGIHNVDEAPKPDWEAVFHNDLFASNVFLSSKGIDAKTIASRSEYPRIVVGDFGQANTAASMNTYYAKLAKTGFGVPSRPNDHDMKSTFRILALLTEAKCGWVYSRELQEITLCLQRLQDNSAGIIRLLKTLLETRAKLLQERKLVFQPLLE